MPIRNSVPDWRILMMLSMVGLAVTVNFGDTIFKSVRIQHTDLMLAGFLGLLIWAVGPSNLRSTVNSAPKSMKVGVLIWVATLVLIMIVHPAQNHFIKFVGYGALTLTFALVFLSLLRTEGEGWLYGLVTAFLLVHLATNLVGGFAGLLGMDDFGSRDFQGGFYAKTVRTEGLTSHPNRSALVYLVLYGLWSTIALNTRQKLGAWEWVVALLVPLAGLWTISPHAFLVFLPLGAVLLHFSPSIPRIIPCSLIVGGFAACLLVSFVAPWRDAQGTWKLIQAPRAIVQQSSFATIAKEPLIGHGLAHRGATVFSAGYPPKIYNRPTDPHNAYLDLLCTGGVVLLLGYLALIFSLPGWRDAPVGWRLMMVSWLGAGIVHGINDERILFFGLAVAAAFAFRSIPKPV